MALEEGSCHHPWPLPLSHLGTFASGAQVWGGRSGFWTQRQSPIWVPHGRGKSQSPGCHTAEPDGKNARGPHSPANPNKYLCTARVSLPRRNFQPKILSTGVCAGTLPLRRTSRTGRTNLWGQSPSCFPRQVSEGERGHGRALPP